MDRKGGLTKDGWAYSMPCHAPLYQRPPFYYRDAHTIAVAYETDEGAARALLPNVAGLELAYPTTARLVVTRQPFTTFGAYDEAYQVLDVLLHGERTIYPVHVLLNNDAAMAAGRELWGSPKKLGHIEWGQEGGTFQGIVERPKGSRLCTILMRPERPMDVEPYVMKPVGLRVIPSPEKDAALSLCELVQVSCAVQVRDAWTGPGSVSFGVHSELDPWHRLPIRRVGQAIYTIGDMEITEDAKIVTRL